MRYFILCVLALIHLHAMAQSNPQPSSSHEAFSADKILNFPATFSTKVSRRIDALDKQLDNKTEQYLRKISRQDQRLYKKLLRKDSLKAKEFHEESIKACKELQRKLRSGDNEKVYNASLDTLNGSLKFLQENPQFTGNTTASREKLNTALDKVKGLDDRFQSAEQVKKFLAERKQYFRQKLGELGFAKEMKRLNKQVYYYGEQVDEYKELLKDQSKIEKKALQLLNQMSFFQDFMKKNGALAALFGMPSYNNDPASQQARLAGLQTRAQVNNLVQQQINAGGPDARQQFQQNIQRAQDQLNQLKNKLNRFGAGGNGAEMPEGFKPNHQKTKSFLQRLEAGVNFQSQKASNWFPVTTDIALTLGYKLTDNGIIGIGAGYKIGWGKDIRHLKVTHQGVALRSFLDWKIKGSFWLTGGFEMNYRSEFKQIEQLKDLNAWQQSGLVGVSKVVSMQTKFFRKTKLQLLWDFLSYRQVPETRPLIFRIGYSLK